MNNLRNNNNLGSELNLVLGKVGSGFENGRRTRFVFFYWFFFVV